MKRINLFISIAMVCISSLLIGQKEGTIIYTETRSFDFEAPEGMEDMFKDMPKSQSSEKRLIFKDGRSLYMLGKDGGASHEHEAVTSDGMGETVMQIKIQEPDVKTYSDFNKDEVVSQQEIMMKPFLIKDKLKKYNWKISSDRRQILDHQCMKATAEDGENSITAWFTPKIQMGVGPIEYNGLPGAILMIETNDGNHEIVAKSISFEQVDDSEMVAPDKGKKVNREKFDQINKEKMEELEAMEGGNGVRMIIRN